MPDARATQTVPSLPVSPKAMAEDASEVVARLQEAVQAGHGWALMARGSVKVAAAASLLLSPDGSHCLPSRKPEAMA